MGHETGVVTEETETSWRALLDLTPQMSQALKRAREEARAMRHRTVEPEHQLLALFGDQGGITASVFADAGLTVSPARDLVRERLGLGSGQPAEGRIPFSRAAMEAMDAASRVAFAVGSEKIGTEHLLLAMVALLRDGGAFQILHELDVDPEVMRVEIKKHFQRPRGPHEDPQAPRVSGRGAALGPLSPTHDWH